ncbi:hypothetical protein HZS_314 [Henneguya salminicola]|nr:hypothetical protein HZS_314 [Henneguya salminicola]
MWRKIQEKCLSTLYVNEHLFRKKHKNVFASRILSSWKCTTLLRIISSDDSTEISDNNPYLHK